MAGRTKHVNEPGANDLYLRLIRAFPLRPIRTEAELDGAIAMIDALVVREDLDVAEQDSLDVLGDLVHKYEAEHTPIPSVGDGDMVQFLLESSGMARAELAERCDIAESTLAEIIGGKRRLSRRQIESLSRAFHVSPAVFFTDSFSSTRD